MMHIWELVPYINTMLKSILIFPLQIPAVEIIVVCAKNMFECHHILGREESEQLDIESRWS